VLLGIAEGAFSGATRNGHFDASATRIRFFVISDISGFLAGVEFEHEQDVIADVMDTMVRRPRPPFRLMDWRLARKSRLN
jgi:hypothetical protein